MSMSALLSREGRGSRTERRRFGALVCLPSVDQSHNHTHRLCRLPDTRPQRHICVCCPVIASENLRGGNVANHSLDIPTFLTDTGVVVRAVTSDEMRRVDEIATTTTGPNLYQMMENAGRNLAQAALEHLGDRVQDRHIVVLAGTGGNAGGGICAARHLANHGYAVSLVLTSEHRLNGVAGEQLNVFRGTSGQEVGPTDVSELKPDLVLDAMIGYGLRNEPVGTTAALIETANRWRAPTMSLDVPSGVDATTGRSPGASIKPDVTVTLALPKTGLVGVPGAVQLADIGIPRLCFDLAGLDVPAQLFTSHYLIPITLMTASHA
jgi:NAD(P)H-hydrate epimerase